MPRRFADPPARRGWHSRSLRNLAWQVLALAAVAAVGAWLLGNTLENMRSRGIQSGFDFLSQPAGFSIGDSLLPFGSGDSLGRAFLAGLANTLRVSVPGIVLATVLGTLVGVGRLSRNGLLRSLCGAYVDLFRNVPLLLLLFMGYFMLTELLPPVDEALNPLPGIYASKSGLQFAVPVWNAGHLALDMPVRDGMAIEGGAQLTPEYLTVLAGLVIYTAAYIAEVVRAGILSVARGQHEACAALGLSRRQALRLVLLPQALRVLVPPLTNQYLNLVKNSSLAVAVGYPDLVSISNTTLNQSGRAVECIAIVMLCYLCLSLLTSLAMNRFNRRVQIRER